MIILKTQPFNFVLTLVRLKDKTRKSYLSSVSSTVVTNCVFFDTSHAHIFLIFNAATLWLPKWKLFAVWHSKN